MVRDETPNPSEEPSGPDNPGDVWASPGIARIRDFQPIRPGRTQAVLQDFLAGTAPIDGTALLRPTEADGSSSAALPSVVTLMIGEPAFRIEPALNTVFQHIDQVGAVAVLASVEARLVWAAMIHLDDPLARLTVEMTMPVRMQVSLALRCAPCRDTLAVAARGGLLGISTVDRMMSVSGGSFADALQQCILLRTQRSESLTRLVETLG